jgi:hypothetical protein
MRTQNGFILTNVPAQERTVVRVAKVPGEPGDHPGEQVVTIWARGRKGIEQRKLSNVCTRVREDLATTAVAYYSATLRRVSQRWQLRERVPDQDW